MGAEQIETKRQEGRKLMLVEFKYAPESYERALSIALGPHAGNHGDYKVWLGGFLISSTCGECGHKN